MSASETRTPRSDGYPSASDADADWWSEEEGCLHGVPWAEDCYECELDEEQFCD